MKLSVEEIARIAHEANRELQRIQNDPTIPVAGYWDEIGTELQDSICIGVMGVLMGNSPQQSHELWIDTKKSQGWVHGPVKSETHKTHPLLVPYNELDESAQLKDALFSAIVKACHG